LLNHEDLLVLVERQKFLVVADHEEGLLRHLGGEVHILLAGEQRQVVFAESILPAFSNKPWVKLHAQQATNGVIKALDGEFALFDGALDAEEALRAGIHRRP